MSTIEHIVPIQVDRTNPHRRRQITTLLHFRVELPVFIACCRKSHLPCIKATQSEVEAVLSTRTTDIEVTAGIFVQRYRKANTRSAIAYPETYRTCPGWLETQLPVRILIGPREINALAIVHFDLILVMPKDNPPWLFGYLNIAQVNLSAVGRVQILLYLMQSVLEYIDTSAGTSVSYRVLFLCRYI
jgi:hypothetical protein